MKYTCEITINLPRHRVVELMDSTENLMKWQDGLQSVEHISGAPGAVGSKMILNQKMGKRTMAITETVTERALPDRLAFTYEADGVYNPLANTFTETPDGNTHWQIDTEFRCKGFIRVVESLMPEMFRKQTMKMMADLKSFAEGESV